MQASNDIPHGGIFGISLVFSQTKGTGLVTNPHEIKKIEIPSEKFEFPQPVMV